MTNNNRVHIYQKCGNCDFAHNTAKDTVCQICKTPLIKKKPKKSHLEMNGRTPQRSESRKKSWQYFSFINSSITNRTQKFRLWFLSLDPNRQFWLKLILGIFLGSLGGTLVLLKIPEITVKETSNSPKELSLTQQIKDFKIYRTISEVPNVPQGIFNYGGSICFAALAREGLNQTITDAHPQFQLRYVEPRGNPGCSLDTRMLLEKELSFGSNARPLRNSEHRDSQDRGLRLESIPIGIDGIVVYTNPSLDIKSLSLEQLRDIYLGKIKNWQELGSSQKLPVVAIALNPTNNNDLQLLTAKENLTMSESVKIVRDYTTAIREVASTPGAISLASTAIVSGQNSIKPIALAKERESIPVSALLADGTVNLQAFKLNSYPLTRRLFVVIRRDGTIEEQAGVAYTNFLISEQGQSIVRKAGFVPLYLVD